MADSPITACLGIAALNDSVDFERNGISDGDKVTGDEWVILPPDGSVHAEITYIFGDDTTLKAIQ